MYSLTRTICRIVNGDHSSNGPLFSWIIYLILFHPNIYACLFLLVNLSKSKVHSIFYILDCFCKRTEARNTIVKIIWKMYCVLVSRVTAIFPFIFSLFFTFVVVVDLFHIQISEEEEQVQANIQFHKLLSTEDCNINILIYLYYGVSWTQFDINNKEAILTICIFSYL